MPLIAISGVDGSGKSTQISMLVSRLETHGKSTQVRWFRPGYSPHAVRLKRWFCMPSGGSRGGSKLQGVEARRRDSAMGRPTVRLAWLLFAGIDSMIELGIIARIKSRRDVIVYDRWEFDAILDLEINFSDRPLVVSAIGRAISFVCRRPDVELLLAVSREIAARRLTEKDEPFPDSAEVAAQRLRRYEARMTENNALVVDGSHSLGAVHEEIWARVQLADDSSKGRWRWLGE